MVSVVGIIQSLPYLSLLAVSTEQTVAELEAKHPEHCLQVCLVTGMSALPPGSQTNLYGLTGKLLTGSAERPNKHGLQGLIP